MNAFSPLCTVWYRQVKEFFTRLHGHQSKTLAMFVLGAIKAESIVLTRVAEALLAESEAKAPSIERRLERFLSNPRIESEKTWDEFLGQVISLTDTFLKGKKPIQRKKRFLVLSQKRREKSHWPGFPRKSKHFLRFPSFPDLLALRSISKR